MIDDKKEKVRVNNVGNDIETKVNNIKETNKEENENEKKKKRKILEKNKLYSDFLNLYNYENILHAKNFLKLLPYLSKLTLKIILDAGSAILLPHHIR